MIKYKGQKVYGNKVESKLSIICEHCKCGFKKQDDVVISDEREPFHKDCFLIYCLDHFAIKVTPFPEYLEKETEYIRVMEERFRRYPELK
ncbi:hypothetical protein EV207_101186 [Scopulibacillus darangshiensis]|uniref:Uncharacterized protein n=1 Tax=Scopulibacillus darangshiensis TaxID=442528 RepID=A0A4R2PCQ3_9BACL|nr:hypothetical protein [Scopulibacillus darangshiensis]TCP32208.1 hypothetical protein EV207_101186 [Scopulibacillus darangshiensis]